MENDFSLIFWFIFCVKNVCLLLTFICHHKSDRTVISASSDEPQILWPFDRPVRRISQLVLGSRQSPRRLLLSYNHDEQSEEEEDTAFLEQRTEEIEMERSQIWFAVGTLTIGLLFASALADGDVVVLTEANFEKEVGQDRGALVEFYAPWYLRSLHFSMSAVFLLVSP